MGVTDRFETSNRALCGITDAFVAVARRQKEYLVRNEGFSASKIHVIHNGIDPHRFAPQAADPTVRSSRGIPDGAPLAGIVACLRREKSIETFLEATVLVRRQRVGAHFVIVGDGPERGRLEQTSSQLGLNDCVHFTGMCGDVRPWLHAMDVVTLVSICEAFPVSLLEAMGCGKPVVATAVGAIPEMVVHGKTGLLVAPRTPEQVASALCQLFDSAALARQMGRAARQHVENSFTLDSMVQGYESLFRRLLDNKRAKRTPAGQRHRLSVR
jgi:glycosyltransferase involved in cell wall biosynthesis